MNMAAFTTVGIDLSTLAPSGHANARSDEQRGAEGIAQRQAMIAETAYFLAESRGFEAGHDLEDWLAAEREVDQCSANAEASTFRAQP
jgi:hypothetical protein